MWCIQVAVVTPFLLLLVLALQDYEQLLQMLTSATSEEVRRFLVFWIALVFTSLMAFMAYTSWPRPALRDNPELMAKLAKRDISAWFYRLDIGGSDLAVRETMTRQMPVPSVSMRYEIQDLIALLNRKDNKGGSDLLDRRVLQQLAMPQIGLKPTQRLDDAQQLLRMRYGGAASKYEWDARIDHNSFNDSYAAHVIVREPATTHDAPWLRSHCSNGPSEALAVTIAVLERESWVFSSLPR